MHGFLLVWNLSIGLATIVLAFVVPLNLVIHASSLAYFSKTAYDITTVLFILDIPISFYAARVSRSVMDEEAGTRFYLKTWFFFDLVAACPFVIFFDLPVLGLFHLVKLVKVGPYLARWRHKSLRFSNAILLVLIVFWFFLIAHWISLGWMALRGMNPNEDTVSDYINAFYWTVMTMTSVGYGDIIPITSTQKLYAALVMLMGFGLLGYVIGNVVAILSKRDPARTRFLENVEKLAVSTKYRTIPRDLQQRIMEYYTYLWKQRMGFDEPEFLSGLPASLRTEVSLSLKKDALERIHLFQGADERFLRDIALHLVPVVFTPGDYIFKAGDASQELFFIIRGSVEILAPNTQERIALLSDGDFFGEIALFLDTPRTASVRTLTYCDLYVLTKETHDAVLARYPEIVTAITEKALARQNRDRV